MKTDANGQDTNWLKSVFERFEAPLVRYASRLVGDADRGRDITQDAFLRLCRVSPKPPPDQVAAWLYTVCRNRAFDVRKKEQRMSSLSSSAGEVASTQAADPARVAEQQDTADLARVVLNSLPASQQEVIRLKLEHGLSYRAIGEVTGHTVSNVGYLLHQGLQTLRSKLANRPTDGPP